MASLFNIRTSKQDDISLINYEELENKYDIHKYYPKYFHNEEVSTPDIKELVFDKPIYAKANEHMDGWINPGVMNVYETELDLKSGRLRIKKEKQNGLLEDKKSRKDEKKDKREERREERREQREERREERREQRLEKQQDRYARKASVAGGPPKDKEQKRREKIENKRRLKQRQQLIESKEKKPEEITFNNPFGNQESLEMYRNTYHHNGNHERKNSVTSRLISLISNNSDELKLMKTNSFDQSKSAMTNGRKKSLFKKRYSEHIEIITEQAHDGYTDQVVPIQYTQSQMVGHGSFGVVFQTQLLPSNEVFAIKRVLQDKRFKNRELQIMKLIHHQNVVDLKFYFYKQNEKNELYLNLILDFIPETLYKASHYYVSKRLSMPLLEIKLYSYQMLRALNFIHCQGICHRDIKPQNLLINPATCELKLCDFGSAKILNPSEPNVSYICSRYYRAPELIFGSINYTTQIDVWSAGCVIAELILGQPLFPGESGIDQLVEIIKILGTPSREQIRNMNPNYMEHKFPQIKPIPLNKIFKKMPADSIAFLSRLLQYNPLERLNCFQSLLDPYFDELRLQSTKLPNFRKLFPSEQYNHSGSPALEPDVRDMPPLFNFNAIELSVSPSDNSRLVPAWAHDQLLINSALSEFTPLSHEDLRIQQL